MDKGKHFPHQAGFFQVTPVSQVQKRSSNCQENVHLTSLVCPSMDYSMQSTLQYRERETESENLPKNSQNWRTTYAFTMVTLLV